MTTSTGTTNIAIACQGGGAHSAFTAGVLEGILTSGVLDDGSLRLVAISGTSGGALCGLLTWYGLLRHPHAPDRGRRTAAIIEGFWADNSAHEWWDAVANTWTVWWRRLEEAGVALPAPPLPVVQDWTLHTLRALLEKHVDFAAVPDLLAACPEHPTLYFGAADVLRGDFLVFEECCPDPDWRRTGPDSRPERVGVEAALASAAMVPTLPAVRLDPTGHRELRCWDGMFAYNPPIRCLLEQPLDRRPDEIWVIQLDPQDRDTEPVLPAEIVDRRFELSSNLSLNGELHWIRQVNRWVADGTLPPDRFKHVRVARVEMTKPLRDGLDLASKADRSPSRLRDLAADGARQAGRFLADRAAGAGNWWEPE